MTYAKRKTVHVNAYPRFRLGKWESVCQHWRSQEKARAGGLRGLRRFPNFRGD